MFESAVKDKSDADKAKMFKTLDVSFTEKVKFFETNAYGFASGIIDLETSNFVYNKLKDFDNTTLGERILITKLMSDVLKAKIAGRIG